MCLSLSKEKTIPGDSSRRLNNATDGRIIIKKSCECDKHIYGSMWTNARVLYIGHQGRCRRRPINYNIFSRLSRSATAAKKKKNTGPGCTILLSLLRWQQLKVNNIFYDDGDDDEVGNGAFSNTCGRVDPVCVLKKNNNCITFPIDRERGVGCLPASMGVSHDPLRFPFLFFLLSFCVAVVVFAARHISWS